MMLLLSNIYSENNNIYKSDDIMNADILNTFQVV